MRLIETATGVPRDCDLAFHDEDHVVRLTDERWRRYSGWCGHQHVPHNAHGDPGAIDVTRLL